MDLDERKQKILKANGNRACDIICGIRPQHITLDDDGLSGRVEVSEMLGSEFNLHVDCDGDDVIVVLPTVGLKQDVSQGAKIEFTTTPDLIQLFDKETGNNLIWYDAESVEAGSPRCRSYE